MGGVAVELRFGDGAVKPSVLAAMAEQVRYRGSHGIRQVCDGSLGMLHLATRGDARPQPLQSACGRYRLVADIRLDDRPDLLRRLQITARSDHPLDDADLLLRAWQTWGEGCLPGLLGDFSMAVWDRAQRSLFLARDPLGVRSLFFATRGDTWCAATEAQQILAHPAFAAELDAGAASLWLSGAVGSQQSLFRDIETVQPGELVVVNRHGCRRRRFWQLSRQNTLRYRQPREYAEHLHALLRECVADRLHGAGAVVGTEMSGGLDSTTVTALAAELAPSNHQRLEVYSHRFHHLDQCDEGDYQAAVARHLHLQPRYIDAERHGAFDYPSGHPPSLESPWIVHESLLAHQLELLKRAGGRVLLTGHGGDELMGGSMFVPGHRFWHGDWRVLREIVRACREDQLPLAKTLYSLLLGPYLPESLHRALKRIFQPDTTGRIDVSAWLAGPLPPAPQGHLQQGRYPRYVAAILDGLQHGAMAAVMGTYDYVAQRQGIEIRHPLLDRRLLEFACAVPAQLWEQDLLPKWLLRQAMRGYLPEVVLARKDKTYFGEVYEYSLRRQLPFLREVFAESGLERRGLLKNAIFEQAFRDCLGSDRYITQSELYLPMTFLIWYHRHGRNLADPA